MQKASASKNDEVATKRWTDPFPDALRPTVTALPGKGSSRMTDTSHIVEVPSPGIPAICHACPRVLVSAVRPAGEESAQTYGLQCR
jgi:hypothetical protein